MQELRQVLSTHIRRYPQMTVADLVKLVYQNEFGSGHFVVDAASALARLQQEFATIERDGTQRQLFEAIGNQLTRLHLQALDDTFSLATVNRFFVLTAEQVQGSVERFEQKLQVLHEMQPSEDLVSYLKEYKQVGYPAMSHSEQYRQAYAPSYRVVREEFALHYPIFRAIEERLRTKKPLVVAIDGRSGAGKSTLAKLLGDVYDCSVISMDHFFLRPAQRSSERLEEPGGNVDYERFAQEVLSKLKEEKSFRYQIYDCQQDTMSISPLIENQGLVVVEGSYSHHPSLVNEYDLKVFLTLSPESQRERLLKRNPAMLQRFLTEWIPLEELYLSACKIQARSDLVLVTDSDVV